MDLPGEVQDGVWVGFRIITRDGVGVGKGTIEGKSCSRGWGSIFKIHGGMVPPSTWGDPWARSVDPEPGDCDKRSFG